jgi:hypothetical protein
MPRQRVRHPFPPRPASCRPFACSLSRAAGRLIKIGARIVRQGRYVVFQLAEVAVPRGSPRISVDPRQEHPQPRLAQRGSLDAEAIKYALQDARDALALHRHYHARLEEEGLLPGYQVIRRAMLLTAAVNLAGMALMLR